MMPQGGGGGASPQDIADQVFVRLTPRFEVVMDELNRGTGARAACSEALKKPLALLEQQLVQQFKANGDAVTELRKVRIEAVEATSLNKHYTTELEATKQKLAAEHDRTKNLIAKQHTIDAELTKAKRSLDDAAKLGGIRFVKGIQKIEQRSNVALNVGTGTLEIRKPIEFKVRKPSEAPVAAFANEAAAAEVLQDAAEILQVFPDVPITIEAHAKREKGGTEAFWEQLTANRADVVKRTLGSKGIDLGIISTVGLPGKKGLNTNSVIFRLQLEAIR